jgi:aerobic carbon-monoxide dehydrogenase medium subunit
MRPMKPAPFEYRAPEGLEEALTQLAGAGDDAKVLAGGQSLVPSMNFRLARPSVLIDINGVRDLEHIEVGDGVLRIGALVRHVRFEERVIDNAVGWLLQRASPFVGHLPIRVRGTFGGSIAHADPAAEWCLLAATLDAIMVTRSLRGERHMEAKDFFVTVFTTALDADELLTEVRIPLLDGGARTGFVEFSRRAGDFAIVAVAAVLSLSNGRIESARIGLGGVGGTPYRASRAEDLLRGEPPSERLFADASDIAADDVEPIGDIHGSPEYRKDLVRALTHRALEQCVSGHP